MITLLQHSLNLGDILIKDGVIIGLGDQGKPWPTPIDETIDCSTAYIWPGLIDSHVHFRVPGEEHKEDWITGSRAALAGGVTSVVDMPSNIPPILSMRTLANKNERVGAQAALQYKLILGVSDDTVSEAVARLVVGVKVYLTPHSTGMGIRTGVALEKLFQQTQSLLLIHAEDNALIQTRRQTIPAPQAADHSTIRNEATAVQAVSQILQYVRQYRKPTYFCHVSTAAEIELIRSAKQEGLPVYAEVTPHHLLLNTADYDRLGMLAKVNPPLRTAADNTALLQAVRDGIIDTIATDHAPHLLSEKQQPYDQAAAGYPSIEFLLPLLLTLVHESKLTLADIERCCITNPARIFGFHKQIALYERADVVAFESDTTWTIEQKHIKSRASWSPYLGRKIYGQIVYVQAAR